MDIYRCLDDVITKVENQEQIIIKARLYHGALAIIDLHKLKYNSRLDGADVFKMLFGISDTNPFGDYAMEVDDNGYITIFQALRISQRDWTLFNIFLNTGTVPYYDAYRIDKTYLPQIVSNLNTLQEVCAKFGGIPSFDLFCENVYAVVEDSYKPLTSEEDKDGKYQWVSCRSNCQTEVDNFINRIRLVDGWSLGSIDLTEVVAVHYYYRKWPE